MPLVRLLEPALPGADGTGERTANVAEQLGLEECLRNRAAVERDKTVRSPGAVVVNGARDDLLAGSGFSGDQNRAVRSRHGLEQMKQLLHRPAAPQDAAELIALFELGS